MTRIPSILLCCIISAVSYASQPKITSLSDAFHKFSEESRGADLDSRIQSWIENFESQKPDVFSHILLNGGQGDLQAARKSLAEQNFPYLIANADAILAQFKVFETAGRKAIERSASAFPEVDLSDIEVIGLPSMFRFNGQVKSIGGKTYVMFGMDLVARIDQQPDFKPGAYLINDVPVLMAHEFTHALHFKASDFGENDDSHDSFLAPLWIEGIAQVNSQMFVPGSNLERVFMEKMLAEHCTFSNVQSWSRQYLKDADGPDSEFEKAYKKWFTMAGDLPETGVYRAGYCLGYNLIESALRSHSLNELLRMKRVEAYQIARMILKDFSVSAP